MTDETTTSAAYVPPSVWHWDKENGGRFANINRRRLSTDVQSNLMNENSTYWLIKMKRIET